MKTPGGCRRSRSAMRGSCEGCKLSAPVLRPSLRANGAREMRARWQAPRSSPDTVIPGWSAGPDPESRDSGFDASHRPGMTVSLKHRDVFQQRDDADDDHDDA